MSSITLFSYSNVFHDLVAFSLEKTLSAKTFDDVVVFSNKKLKLSQKYRHYDIIGYKNYKLENYSKFMIENLNSFIETDFVLLTQYDGMATNNKFWDDSYYEYDYIGAPFHAHLKVMGPVFYEYDLPKFKKWVTGNGGFSLRSKKLLNILQNDKKIKFHFSPIYVFDWIAEDVFICFKYREYLEKEHGIKFAPLDVAINFSTEYFYNEGLSFGFHKIHNIPTFLSEDECCYYYNRLKEYSKKYFMPHRDIELTRAYALKAGYDKFLRLFDSED